MTRIPITQPTAGLSLREAFAARASQFDAFSGQWVTVYWRHHGPVGCTEGQLIGSSWPRTNGNSTGDLIIEARGGLESIALCHITAIEVDEVLA